MLFTSDGSLQVSASGELFVEITYLDRGYGRLVVTARGVGGDKIKADKYTRTVFSDSGAWVVSSQRLKGLRPGTRAEISIGLDRNRENTLIIGRVSAQATVFKSPLFQYLIDEPWRRPYTGPTLAGIDNRTLKGKAVVGYQGWFRTPNDPYDTGWVHWGNIPKGEFTVDMWPDVSMYPPEILDKAADVKTRSGKPAYLFSSAWPQVVRQHFAWMRTHAIDGAFLQRFLTDPRYPSTGSPEWVMSAVREAANREGRIWAIEYDVSGYGDDRLLDGLKADWKWLIDEFGLRKDPAYAREGGKPVVFVWGMAVGGRNIRPETAEAVFNFLKNDPVYGGNYVIGGLPGNWRNLGPEWSNHIRQHDGVLAWMSQEFEQDNSDFKKLGLDYFAHVKPGFSWANLKHIATGSTDAFTPREAGAYYQRMLDKAADSGANRLFVGMYDEYDESTAIIPMSDDPPPTPARPGVYVKIFGGDRWEGRASVKVIPQIDLEFAAGPPEQGMPESGYQVLLSGCIVASNTGSYTFSLRGPEGGSAVFQLAGRRMSVAFPDAKAITLTVELKGNERTHYKLEYRHGNRPGALQLYWATRGSAAQLVPSTAFIDAWGRFLTNEGKPADHWLTLTGKWEKRVKD